MPRGALMFLAATPSQGLLLLLLLLLLGAAAQRRWLELRTLRLGDGSLLPAGARDTVRACGGVARLSELRVRGAPLLSDQPARTLPACSARSLCPAVLW